MMGKVRIIAKGHGVLPSSSTTRDVNLPWSHPGLGPQKSLHRIPTDALARLVSSLVLCLIRERQPCFSVSFEKRYCSKQRRHKKTP